MTDGLMLPPGSGSRIQTVTLKVGAEHSKVWSAFEADVAPGFDVGAHVHQQAEELFYILEGELDLLAFHPAGEAGGDWRAWRSESGAEVLRGRPGSFMYVPAGCPHAFFNPGSEPARMLFLVSPSGHELYLRELADLLAASTGLPDQAKIAELRARHDIHQLTPLTQESGLRRSVRTGAASRRR
ncbi:cupin domain-containing protein [Acrocarpospora sp. B8E8]|uniref:cupin domain-containing protein n=1 Tax=Acrocarpospora sp. B8E8 TaxID=3153572 RepID=UPI00325E2A8C